MYSSYCDCGKFIQAVDFPMPSPVPEETPATADEEEPTESRTRKGKMKAEERAPAPRPQLFAYFISRGVELLDSEERMIGRSFGYEATVSLSIIDKTKSLTTTAFKTLHCNSQGLQLLHAPQVGLSRYEGWQVVFDRSQKVPGWGVSLARDFFLLALPLRHTRVPNTCFRSR